jgi:hypothetical protein
MEVGYKSPKQLYAEKRMTLAATNTKPKVFHPFCKTCGWRKGGVDSWNGHACKCGHSEPPIVLVE